MESGKSRCRYSIESHIPSNRRCNRWWCAHPPSSFPLSSSAASFAGKSPALYRHGLFWRQRPPLHETMWQIAAYPATGSVFPAVAVPVGIQFFSENQQRCGFCQRFFFTAQFFFKFTNTLLIRFSLYFFCQLTFTRGLLTIDTGLTSGLYLFGIQPLTPAVFTEFCFRQRRGFNHNSKFGFR